MVNFSTSSAKFFRRFLCLILAFVFAFGCVIRPLEARATAATVAGIASVVGIPAEVLAGAVAIGASLMPLADDTTSFGALAETIGTSLFSAWGVTEGLLKAVVFNDRL